MSIQLGRIIPLIRKTSVVELTLPIFLDNNRLPFFYELQMKQADLSPFACPHE